MDFPAFCNTLGGPPPKKIILKLLIIYECGPCTKIYVRGYLGAEDVGKLVYFRVIKLLGNEMLSFPIC